MAKLLLVTATYT